MVAEVNCPECHTPRSNASTTTCVTCGAPPIREGDQRQREDEVRTQDLEPYSTLTYIARLFKVLAVIIAVLLIAEIVLGISREGIAALAQLLTEITQLLVLAGGLWGVGDLTLLAIDAGHDLRVARILLGRINAELHRRGGEIDDKTKSA